MEENQGLKIKMLRLQRGDSEHSLVELKARVENIDSFRKRLSELKAERIGSFHQTDTYFEVPKGRLKLRQMEGATKPERFTDTRGLRYI